MGLTAAIDQNPDRRTFNGHMARGTIITSGTLTFDDSYPTGGEAITAANVGLNRAIDRIIIESAAGYVFKYDKANKKVLAYYADYDASSDGALIQVANTTDLSASAIAPGYIAVGQ